MLYKVTKKYQRGTAIEVAKFAEMADAKTFITAKLKEDVQLKVNVLYQLWEGLEVTEEFTQNSLDQEAGSSDSGGQQRASGETFRPTPFTSAPRPAGMPQHWLKDEDKKKE